MYSSNVYIGNPMESVDKLSELVSDVANDFLGIRLIFKSQFYQRGNITKKNFKYHFIID